METGKENTVKKSANQEEKKMKNKRRLFSIRVAYPCNHPFYEETFIRRIKAKSLKQARIKAQKLYGEYVR